MLRGFYLPSLHSVSLCGPSLSGFLKCRKFWEMIFETFPRQKFRNESTRQTFFQFRKERKVTEHAEKSHIIHRSLYVEFLINLVSLVSFGKCSRIFIIINCHKLRTEKDQPSLPKCTPSRVCSGTRFLVYFPDIWRIWRKNFFCMK